MHQVVQVDAAPLDPLPGYEGRCDGFTRTVLVGADAGAVLMGLGLCRLGGAGSVDAHVHSYEEGFYVLEGQIELALDERAYLLEPGDYGFVPLGARHALRNPSGAEARWLEMSASQPRTERRDSYFPHDTFFVPGDGLPTEAAPPDFGDPRTRHLGHFDRSQLPPAAAISMDGYSGGNIHGVSIKPMVDRNTGSALLTMFMVQFQPGGHGTPHDHPYEESYFFLAGQAEATLDGEVYRVGPGDVVWSSVGGTHGFRCLGDGPVWWLETQAPQPPARHAFRFARDWEHLAQELHGH